MYQHAFTLKNLGARLGSTNNHDWCFVFNNIDGDAFSRYVPIQIAKDGSITVDGVKTELNPVVISVGAVIAGHLNLKGVRRLAQAQTIKLLTILAGHQADRVDAHIVKGYHIQFDAILFDHIRTRVWTDNIDGGTFIRLNGVADLSDASITRDISRFQSYPKAVDVIVVESRIGEHTVDFCNAGRCHQLDVFRGIDIHRRYRTKIGRGNIRNGAQWVAVFGDPGAAIRRLNRVSHTDTQGFHFDIVVSLITKSERFGFFGSKIRCWTNHSHFGANFIGRTKEGDGMTTDGTIGISDYSSQLNGLVVADEAIGNRYNIATLSGIRAGATPKIIGKGLIVVLFDLIKNIVKGLFNRAQTTDVLRRAYRAHGFWIALDG